MGSLPPGRSEEGAASDATDDDWQPASPNLELGAADVHVWRADLDLPPERLSELTSELAADERERAEPFRLASLPARFLAARGQLRQILGRYLNMPPEQLRFRYGPSGKPVLAGAAERELEFNLSHSDALALVAVTRIGRIGIDVERRRADLDVDEIAERFFSPRECAFLREQGSRPVVWSSIAAGRSRKPASRRAAMVWPRCSIGSTLRKSWPTRPARRHSRPKQEA
jgi:4'-phosphopantetheinyl transferase EntD